MHIFAAFYIFSASMSSDSLYSSFGFATKPTLIGLFLFFQTIWAPIDKVSAPHCSLHTRFPTPWVTPSLADWIRV